MSSPQHFTLPISVGPGHVDPAPSGAAYVRRDGHPCSEPRHIRMAVGGRVIERPLPADQHDAADLP